MVLHGVAKAPVGEAQDAAGLIVAVAVIVIAILFR